MTAPNTQKGSDMTAPLDLDQLRADMEAGTPGPWAEKRLAYCGIENPETGFMVASAGVASTNTRNIVPEQEANARRIARVPDLEARVLSDAARLAAADALAGALEELMNSSAGVAGLHMNDDVATWEELVQEWLPELAAYRAASEGEG